MRAAVCAIVAAIGLSAIPAAHPAFAQADRTAAAFWKSVQATCDATAAKPPGELGRRIAQTAIDEFTSFGGHRIDSNGRLFHFGLTEAEHEEDDSAARQATLGHLGWWQVMKYWRTLFGNDSTTDKLEVLGYRDASTSDAGGAGRGAAAHLCRAAPAPRRQRHRSGGARNPARGGLAGGHHRHLMVGGLCQLRGTAGGRRGRTRSGSPTPTASTSTTRSRPARPNWPRQTNDRIYRACPVGTRPRTGDLICHQRETALADASDEAVRERIRMELASGADARSVRRTHCEVVAHVDARARKVYTIGGNVNQAVTARKQNLRRGLKFSAVQKGHCGGAGQWTLPRPAGQPAKPAAKCSLNDRKWFVLLQVR